MRTMKTASLCGALALLALTSAVRADTVAYYNFDNGTSLFPAPATTTAPNATASSVSTINNTVIGYVSGGRNNTTAINTNFFAPTGGTSNTNNGYTFSITVADGFQLDLTGFSVFTRASNTGPRTSTLFVNGTSSGSFTNPTAFNATSSDIGLALSGLTGTTSFRLVGTGPAANPTSTFADSGTLRLDDLTVSGSVTSLSAVPSPSALSATALFGLTALRRRRASLPAS